MDSGDFETFESGRTGKPYDIGHRCFYFGKEVILFVKSSKYKSVFSSLFD